MGKRPLGRTGFQATIMGLGGEGVLRTFGYEKEAYALINRALDLGINYFESARAYDGSESYCGLALRERRQEIFLASKSHARDKKGALKHLSETLHNMKTGHLDLWQVHDVRTTAVIGCDDVSQLEENVRYASAFTPLEDRERKSLARAVAPFAGQLTYYRP